MKKLLALVLALILCLSLCACGKTDATKAVESQIADLTDITYEDRETVSAARSAYDALTEKEQKKVENLDVLTQAEAVIQAVEEEARRQADEILDTHNNYEAIPLLRQLTQTTYVRNTLTFRSCDLLKSYVLTEGVPCDSSGDPKEDGAYRVVTVELDGKIYQFLLEAPDGQFFYFEQKDSSPRSSMKASGYRIHMRTQRLFMGLTELYSMTEHFSHDGDFFYVSWDSDLKNAKTREEVDKLPVKLDCSHYAHWPYESSQEHLEGYAHLDVVEFVNAMDECIQALELPISAWEVLGIYE